MKLPFLQHTAIGLCVTARAVRWVELARVRERVWFRRYAVEPVEAAAGGVRGALERLTGRVQPDEPFVATHLPPAYVREHVVDIPPFDNEPARRAWVERWAREHLPAAVHLEQFTLRYQLLATGGGPFESGTPTRGKSGGQPDRAAIYGQPERPGRRCLITMARRSAVEERAKMLRAAGLVPIYIGSLTPVMRYAFGFEAAFARGRRAALLLQDGGGQIGLFDRGRMVDLRMLAPAEHPRAACEEARSHVTAWEEGRPGGSPPEGSLPRYVMGEDADTALDVFREEGHAIRVLFEEGPGEAADGPGGADGPAVGLAARVLYESDGAFNLMAPEAVQAVRAEREKRDALRVILGAGVGVLLVWMSIAGATLWLRHQVEAAERALAQAEDRIARVEEAETALQTLRAHLARARQLAQSRTRSADVLAYVSRQVPPDLWLREVTLDPPDTGPGDAGEADHPAGDEATVVLRGWARTEEASGAFVAALERSAGLRDVRPRYVERLSADEVARRSGEAWKRPLRQFEVRIQVPLAGQHVIRK